MNNHGVGIGLRYWLSDISFESIVRVCVRARKHPFYLSLWVRVFVCGFMTDAFCYSPWQAELGQHLKMDNVRQEPVRRRGNPTLCLSTNCVFAVFLLGAQYNKVPFAVYCSILMCSVGAQNFKACCRMTFFSEAKGRASFQIRGSLIYFDNSDMHSCKNINSTK